MQPEAVVGSAPVPPAPPDSEGVPSAPPEVPVAPEQARPFGRPFEFGLIAVIVILDQITKTLVRDALSYGESRTLIPGFVDLTHVQNTGAAFGLLNSVDFPYKSVVMLVVASLALVAIALYGTQLGFRDKIARIGLALILGGAFGNLLDRIIHGHVVDFIQLHAAGYYWPAFNVADSAITVGVALLLWDGVRGKDTKEAKA